ncbi:MAG: TetR/AcrR family transcriptional regulator, partial [Mycobacterium sp.]
MPRPPNPDVRRRLLASGLALVHGRGFAASGVKDITDSAGVPKGSFYAYFSSKEAFAAAILEHYWA